MSLVFVEDDEDDVLLLQHACKKTGINLPTRFFPNGKRAADYFAPDRNAAAGHGAPDRSLVFLDLNMPEMNGFEFLEWRKSQEALRTTPVVILSTSENPVDIKRAYELGANAYLVKPGTIKELSEMLSSAHNFWFNFNRYSES